MKKRILLSFLMTIVMASNSWAGFYVYTQLITKDLDDMNKIIFNRIRDAKKDKGNVATEPLKEAMQALFSRPNDDFLIEKIIAPLKNELDDAAAWENVVDSLVDEAISALQNPKKHKPSFQITYAILLENFLQEFKPRAKEKFEAGIITRIRDANIELSDSAVKERKLKVMRAVKSPSEIAEKIIRKDKK